ncbi:MAG: hypothetical protein AB7L09_19065 [Nitrospira sp.]
MKLRVVEKDPEDDKYLAAAIEGRAGGDSDLPELHEYKGVNIVTARAFLRILEGRK